MSDFAIRVENLGKEYQLGAASEGYKTLRESLSGMALGPVRALQSLARRGAGAAPAESFWALQDVSFEVGQGDVVGVIGRNGAGKSTLLKVLSRITEPTRGRVHIRGRVGSLLEVGTGFHPELSGRENIFLNGAILGMSRSIIEKKFDEIVDFAEVEKFIDTPVKRYSSGMYLRLAFAVAAHLEPEILVVDEVLAVGDVAFQKKCIGKMQSVADHGRTVLFVSHNLEAVQKLCNKGVLLQKGHVLATGSARSVIDKYIESGSHAQASSEITKKPEPGAPGYAYRITLEDAGGAPASEIQVGQPWQVRVHFKIEQRTEHFIVALGLSSSLGLPLHTTWSPARTIEPGDYEVVFRSEAVQFEPGAYPLVVGLSQYERSFHHAEDAGLLQIVEVTGNLEGQDIVRLKGCGLVLNPLGVSVQRVG